MKITIYELLGMVKDGKQPRKIKYKKTIYQYDYKDECYYNRLDELSRMFLDYDFTNLNDEVEILYNEDEEKGLPEKLIPTSLKGIDNLDEKIEIAHIDTISVIDTVNLIIDYLEKQRKGK